MHRIVAQRCPATVTQYTQLSEKHDHMHVATDFIPGMEAELRSLTETIDAMLGEGGVRGAEGGHSRAVG
jgi:hypothetical protein